MDSITHLVLGATIGEAMAGKQLGKKAMLLGALAQSLPDIDIVNSFWMDTCHDLWAHRGITHSFFFVVCMALVFAWFARRWEGAGKLSYLHWCIFFGSEFLVHIVLDAFNAYGTGWFEPFSHYRVSFHTLFVADPFYTIWPLIAVTGLLVAGKGSGLRKYFVWVGLAGSLLYMCYCIFNKVRVDERVRHELQRQDIAYSRFIATPGPFNNWLWYVVAEGGQGFHTGYLSVFDRESKIAFHYFPRQDSLLTPFRDEGEIQCLLRFSQGYYMLNKLEDTLVFNDLRFGQIGGWEDGRAPFVFHYFLQYPGSNKMIVQRGRFSGWNRERVQAFIRRIRGE